MSVGSRLRSSRACSNADVGDTKREIETIAAAGTIGLRDLDNKRQTWSKASDVNKEASLR